MTFRDRASYESLPPCISGYMIHISEIDVWVGDTKQASVWIISFSKSKKQASRWYVRFFLGCVSEGRKQSVFRLIYRRMCGHFLRDVFWAYLSEPKKTYASIWIISKKIKNRLAV